MQCNAIQIQRNAIQMQHTARQRNAIQMQRSAKYNATQQLQQYNGKQCNTKCNSMQVQHHTVERNAM